MKLKLAIEFKDSFKKFINDILAIVSLGVHDSEIFFKNGDNVNINGDNVSFNYYDNDITLTIKQIANLSKIFRICDIFSETNDKFTCKNISVENTNKLIIIEINELLPRYSK